MSTTPRTDAAWSFAFTASEFSAASAARQMRDKCAELETELAAAKAECAEKQATFDLMFSANLRGIKMWQDAHPEHSETWPDLAKLVAWLLSELARLRAQNDQFSDNLSAVGKAYNAEKDRAEKAEAEVERLKGMRTAAEAIMTDVAEANEELAIARAEKAEAEAQLWHNRFASILWSGALNKHTGEDFQKWEAEFKAEQNALIARAEKAEMLLKQSPHWDTVAIIQNRDNYKEDAEKAEKQFKILNETMQHVTVMYDNAITRAEKAEAEVERLTKENNAAHAALNDSVGHFVYEAAIARAEKAEASLHDLSLDLSTANHMIKLERDRADALQTRLKEIESALRKFNLID